MSAIPWIGQDIVEFLWGGFSVLYCEAPFSCEVKLQILLIAGISCISIVGYVLYSLNIDVKKPTILGQSAGVKEFIAPEAPQRLNAEDLKFAYFVGLIEGDGYFSVTKKGDYLSYELGIELSIRDVQLIYKIKALLGVGVVSFRTINSVEMVALRIRNKTHLVNIILPIFDKYPFISDKQYDYLRFKHLLVSGIKKHVDMPSYIRPINSEFPLNSIESIIDLPYFSSWLVGFMEAEACFSICKPTIDASKIASFSIGQTNSQTLILAIAKYLSLSKKITCDKTNHFNLKASSVRSVENVIRFLDRAPVKLLGNKRLQYLLWIKELRTIPRYSKNFEIPQKY